MKNVLAIFAKAPLPGKVKTRLAPGLSPEQGAELYRRMLSDTIARAATLPVDTVVCYDGDEDFFRDLAPGMLLLRQAEGGLGERLEACFAALSSLGFGARVVIGSDAPDLPLDYLQEAFALLKGGSDVVFGPAEDGGYYLVGLKGASGELFREIPWSGPGVLAVSQEKALRAGLAAALLPVWYDVDSFADLTRPGLSDPGNGAPLTRDFLRELGICPQPAGAGRHSR